MAGTGSYKVYPVADYINKAWTTSSGTDHWLLIDEDPANANDTDFVSATVTNKNDQYNLSELLPAVAKEITKIRYGFRCTGRDDSIDCSVAMFKADATALTGFFKKCNIITTTEATDNWTTKYFDKIGTPGGGGPVVTPRADFEGAIKVLMKSITGGTGQDPDLEL